MLHYSSKRRFEIVIKPVPTKDSVLLGVLIRATQGHSIRFDASSLNQKPALRQDLEALEPLVHGTYLENKASIVEKGLMKMSRRAVHFMCLGLNEHKEGKLGLSRCKEGASLFIVLDARRCIDDFPENTIRISANGVASAYEDVPPENLLFYWESGGLNPNHCAVIMDDFRSRLGPVIAADTGHQKKAEEAVAAEDATATADQPADAPDDDRTEEGSATAAGQEATAAAEGAR